MTRTLHTRRPFFLGLVAALFLLLASAAAANPALAQAEGESSVLHGEVRHGGEVPQFDPTAVTVSLSIFEGVIELERTTAQPDASGSFEFPVSPRDGRVYFLTVEYQGARYSASRNTTDMAEPVVLEIFEATHDPEVLTFESYTILVTGAVREDGFIEVMERALVRNDSGMTLVPDLDAPGPGMLSFLRFGLPAGAYNLDVWSSIVTGEILEVDRGFALTMPVTPTRDEPHQVEFVYRLPYGEPELDLGRTMRFGAETLRVVVPADVARPFSARLENLGATDFNGRLLRLYEGHDIAPGEFLELMITELPMPSLWMRFSRAAGGWYLRTVVPGTLAVVAVALLGLALRQRPLTKLLPEADDVVEQREELLRHVADLEQLHRSGALSQRRYEAERARLKSALVKLELRTRLQTSEA